jgi:FixJ family two-component response regulator
VNALSIPGEPTVFLIDDDPAMRQLLADLTCSLELPLEIFNSASVFLQQFDAMRPGCLVVEARMPGMSGLELLEKLYRDGLYCAAIAVSAKADTSTIVRAMKAGTVTFLEKPISERQLWDSLYEALECDAEYRRRQSRIDRIQRRMEKLTEGECEVLSLLLEGKMNREIAAAFRISVRTVEVRRAKIMEKMKASSLAEIIRDVLFVEFLTEEPLVKQAAKKTTSV